MAIGVSYEDFWHGEPELVRYAIATNEIVQKNKAIDEDVTAWNIGRYVMTGVGVVLSQAFSRNSSAKYPAEPMLAIELDEVLARQVNERRLMKQRDDFLAVAAMLKPQNPSGEPSQ